VKALKNYLDKRFGRLKDQLKGYHHLHDRDTLHNIRTEIKKIKTIINLIHFSHPKFKRHANFIPFRSIFRKAGEIRESEVLYQLLLSYEIDGVADEYIPKSIEADQLSIAFQKKVPEFVDIVKERKNKLLKNYKDVSTDSLRDYVKKCKRQLKPLLFPTLQQTKLHAARKLIKEILHLKELGGRAKKDMFLRNVEDLIGQWHDKQILLQLLEKIKNSEKMNQLRAKSRQDVRNLKKLTAQYYSKSKTNDHNKKT
jgi:CHAD domain-containing protein